MKKLTFFFTAILLAVITVISACKKKDDPAPPPPTQEFTFDLKTGTGYVFGDITLKTGEQFKIGINAISSTGNTLSRLYVIRKIDKPSDVIDSALNSTSFNYDLLSVADFEVGIEEWTLKVTQSNGDTLVKSFVITTEPSMGPIFTFDQRIMGAFENIHGSSFSSSDGMIYDIPEAKVNAAMVDWLYYFGTTSSATFASPDDDEAAHVFTDGGTYTDPGPNALLTWPVRNATRFKTITYPIDWDAIQDDSEFFTLTQGATETMAGSLKAGYYIAFITSEGKRGLIQVNDIISGETGQIDISVKVQQ